MRKSVSFVGLLAVLFTAIFAPLATRAVDGLPVSQSNVFVSIGQNASVTFSSPAGQTVNITSISNTAVASANMNNNVMTVYGLGNGSSSITACTFDNYCGTVFVTVGNGNNNDQVTFNPSSVNMDRFQSATVSVYSSIQNQSFYVSGNSNSSILSGSVSGSILTLYAMNAGSSTITVCQNTGGCGTLNVSISPDNSGSPYFITANLPQPVINQNYNYQLPVAGGMAPHTFTLVSGGLPAGLFLSANGFISGMPYRDSATNFTVRVTDNLGRTAVSQNYYLKSGGSVAGALTYSNGTLINDNATFYIIYKNTKSGFANMTAFTQLGYKASVVIKASITTLNNTGYVVSNANITHPWGSWVKNGSTVYFMHESGLIPISNYDVFVNNGGQDKLVVTMNTYDFTRPVLPIMTMSDPRLK